MHKLDERLSNTLNDLRSAGTYKVLRNIAAPMAPVTVIEGIGEVLVFCSNNYLGLADHPAVLEAGIAGLRQYGAGTASVRFICGSFECHRALEQKVAEFFGAEAALTYTSCWNANEGLLPAITEAGDAMVSDELNHASIIDAGRLSRASRTVFAHSDMDALASALLETGAAPVKFVVTDGVFSMRGDYAPLDEIVAICDRHEADFAEGIITIVDDSHGVGAFGASGRGTEEQTGGRADILIGTLGKAFGVNGGYVVADAATVGYLRETSPTYIYSNPITPAEAAAAAESIRILEGAEGRQRLKNLAQRSEQLRTGLTDLGYETIPGDHPIVPIMIRDTDKTSALVAHLFENNILVTGLNYPVVPKGDEEIRLQVSASHTEADIDYLLDALRGFR